MKVGVLSPNRTTDTTAIIRGAEGVVESCDEEEEPTQEGEGLVNRYRGFIVGIAFCEWVPLMSINHDGDCTELW